MAVESQTRGRIASGPQPFTCPTPSKSSRLLGDEPTHEPHHVVHAGNKRPQRIYLCHIQHDLAWRRRSLQQALQVRIRPTQWAAGIRPPAVDVTSSVYTGPAAHQFTHFSCRSVGRAGMRVPVARSGTAPPAAICDPATIITPPAVDSDRRARRCAPARPRACRRSPSPAPTPLQRCHPTARRSRAAARSTPAMVPSPPP